MPSTATTTTVSVASRNKSVNDEGADLREHLAASVRVCPQISVSCCDELAE
jgi:hypothetical protein